MTEPLPAISERTLVVLLSLVQIVHVLDFMMVMPLGPDFAADLGFSVTQTGLIGGAYTFAAALVGLVASLFLDQIPRKRALLFCLAGLSIATILAAFTWDLHSMIAARLIAGAFGGCMMGISNAFIADYVPPERRGKAMGKLMSAFSIASVFGVPFGLELAHYFSWHAPFIATGVIGGIVWVIGYMKLPHHRPYISEEASLQQRLQAIRDMVKERNVILSYIAMAGSMMAAFMVIPNIASFVQMNRDYPREDLAILYFSAGAISYFTTQYAGKIVDRYSASLMFAIATLIFCLVVLVGFVWATPAVPVIVTFVLFMVAMTGRGVAAQTQASKVPKPSQRGAFMSIQSSIMQMAGAAGSYISSIVLLEADGKLVNMEQLGYATIAVAMVTPLLVWLVERNLRGSKVH